MTQDEVYNKYVLWSEGKPELTEKDLFRMSVANRDVYENQNIVVNHLYFLFVKCVGVQSKVFVFYEENTFLKKMNEDLVLIHSTYIIPKD